MGLFNRPSDARLHIPFHLNCLDWIINPEKSNLTPIQVFSFVVNEYHLDSALAKPTQYRWLKRHELILKIKSKYALTARCSMSQIMLLALAKKIREGHLHIKLFSWHLKAHRILDSLLPSSQTVAAYLDSCQNPLNVIKVSDLHPKDYSILISFETSNIGQGTHLEEDTRKGLIVVGWSERATH